MEQKLARLGFSLGSLLVGTSFYSLPMTANAQSDVLEEVIVTARKRAESLQQTPVAVTAINADALREANIRDLAAVTQVVPGLNTQDGAKFAPFSIRGVGSRSGKPVGIDPAVGVYVDGIFIPRADSQLLEVVDVQSVQVLRGPQGTLFGKNTAGGALLVTSIKPEEQFSGEVYTDIGNFNRLNLRAVLNAPISNNLRTRLTVDSRTRDGYMDDAETGIEYGDVDKLALAGQLRWLVTDDLTVDLLVLNSKQDEYAVPETCDVVNPEASLQSFVAPGDTRTGLQACLDSAALLEDDKVLQDRTGVVWKMESTTVGLTLDWEIGDFSLRSISGWLHQGDVQNWRDQDAGPVFSINNIGLLVDQLNANGIDADEERDFISQEFQLNGSAFAGDLEYTLGVFASREELDNSIGGGMISDSGFLGIPAGDLIIALPPVTAGLRVASVTSYKNSTWAVFAQANYHITEQWALTIGGRYGVEDKDVEQFNYTSATPAPAGPLTRAQFDALQGTRHSIVPDPAIPFLKTNADWSDFTPTFSLGYTAAEERLSNTPLDSLLVYATWSQGFKAGGFSRLDQEFESFDPENVTNYELGFKLDSLDRRLRLNMALYYMEYNDMQIAVTRQLDEIRVGLSVANAGEATMRGAELELSYLPNEHWLFNLSANFIDAEYEEFTDLARDPVSEELEAVDRSNEDFAYVPEKTFSASAQYNWDTDRGRLAARLSYYYKDDVFIALSEGLENLQSAYLDSFELWNARVSWRSGGERQIEIALYCDNLADEDYFGTGNIEFANQGSRALVPGIERTYGLQASYRF